MRNCGKFCIRGPVVTLLKGRNAVAVAVLYSELVNVNAMAGWFIYCGMGRLEKETVPFDFKLLPVYWRR